MSDEKSFSVCQEMLPLFRAVLKNSIHQPMPILMLIFLQYSIQFFLVGIVAALTRIFMTVFAMP